jgi:hypothetical protein
LQRTLANLESTAGNWEKKYLIPAVQKAADAELEVSADTILALEKRLMRHAHVMSAIGACWDSVERRWAMTRPIFEYDLLRNPPPNGGLCLDTHRPRLPSAKNSSKIDYPTWSDISAEFKYTYGRFDPAYWEQISLLSYASSIVGPCLLALQSMKSEVLCRVTWQEVRSWLGEVCKVSMVPYSKSSEPYSLGWRLTQLDLHPGESGDRYEVVFCSMSEFQTKSATTSLYDWADEEPFEWEGEIRQSGPCLIRMSTNHRPSFLPVAALILSRDPVGLIHRWAKRHSYPSRRKE